MSCWTFRRDGPAVAQETEEPWNDILNTTSKS